MVLNGALLIYSNVLIVGRRTSIFLVEWSMIVSWGGEKHQYFEQTSKRLFRIEQQKYRLTIVSSGEIEFLRNTLHGVQISQSCAILSR